MTFTISNYGYWNGQGNTITDHAATPGLIAQDGAHAALIRAIVAITSNRLPDGHYAFSVDMSLHNGIVHGENFSLTER